MSSLINNDFKCKHIKFTNQRHRIHELIKKQASEMCYLQEIHFKFKTNIG